MGAASDIINSKPIESLTKFFSEIVGKPLVDGAGILYTDAVKAKRIANTLKLEEKYKLVKSNEVKPKTHQKAKKREASASLFTIKINLFLSSAIVWCFFGNGNIMRMTFINTAGSNSYELTSVL